MEFDIVLHRDPSNESNAVTVIIQNPELRLELENVFYDEIMNSFSSDEFDSYQQIEERSRAPTPPSRTST